MLETVQRELWTPPGLLSLSPRHPDYEPTYHGDLLTRDAAYHQGTVWSWLIGPYADSVLRVHGSVGNARHLLDGVIAHLGASLSARCSTPNRLAHQAVASRKPGASPSRCVACCVPSAGRAGDPPEWTAPPRSFDGCGRHDQCFE